jgi:cyanophycin synthetase
MGHVIEHIALEIQTLAGMECGYGRTRGAGETGVYHVTFSYEVERAGVYAAHAAFRIGEALVKGEAYDIAEDIRQLKRIFATDGLGPSTKAIVEEAVKRGIPFTRLDDESFVLFGQGKNQRRIRATMTDATSGMGIDFAGDKADTKRMLAKAYLPVAKSSLVRHEEDLISAVEEVGFPVVVKPIDGNHGRGITTNIRSHEQALNAFRIAKGISNTVMIEKFVQGYDYRFLVINYKLVAVAKRTPAMVIGDGSSTIRQLIDQVNKEPGRGDGHENVLTTIKVDKITENILTSRGFTLDSVLPIGEILFLKNTANLSTGGTSRDVTDLVHPDNLLMAERVARLVGLDICGIDVVAQDINIPITTDNGAILEVNACPGFRMHLAPSKGLGRNVAAPVVDMLYPEGKQARIPLVAVTGTNGKTTTTRLISHIAAHAGHKTGYTTTDGIYIQGRLVHAGDCTGPVSARAVLMDPTVDYAVLECARGGILRAGLGFDNCNISVVTNISEDHLGLNSIDSVREMAKVKAVVARSTFDNGYAILNADDDLVYDMRHDLDCNIALFSMNEHSERIRRHCADGGLAIVVEEKGYVTICKGQWKTRVEKVARIPLCIEGKASCMIKNVLPSVLAAHISGFSVETIRAALSTFIPSPQNTPGRMNIFHFKNFDLMIDYAHNVGGFEELKQFIRQNSAPSKVGIITGVGDRREEDIRALGFHAAQMFTEVIIRHDDDMRGRSRDEVTNLILEGIHSVNPGMSVTVISDEIDAIRYAMENAQKGAFITTCTDKVQRSIDFVTNALMQEQQSDSASFDYVLSRAS